MLKELNVTEMEIVSGGTNSDNPNETCPRQPTPEEEAAIRAGLTDSEDIPRNEDQGDIPLGRGPLPNPVVVRATRIGKR